MASIVLQGVKKSFGPSEVLKGIDLKIENGSFFTLLGPSGCGKTTLLRLIAGFNDLDAGVLRFDDDDVGRLPAHKRDIGMVFQDYALFPDKTIFDNVAYGLRARRIAEAEVRRRVGEHLDKVGLADLSQRLPAQLSGGQRQRAALARALVIKPRVLLMDEPLSNLDAKLRHAMRETILELQRASRITTVFVTHDQEEALSMSDRIAIMKSGAIEQTGSPRDLYGAPASGYVADFVGSANVLDVTITERMDHERIKISCIGRELVVRAAPDLQAGPGKLILRREDIAVDWAGKSCGENILPGKLALLQYLGATVLASIALDDGKRVQIVFPSADATSAPSERADVSLIIPRTSRVVRN